MSETALCINNAVVQDLLQ